MPLRFHLRSAGGGGYRDGNERADSVPQRCRVAVLNRSLSSLLRRQRSTIYIVDTNGVQQSPPLRWFFVCLMGPASSL